MGDRFSTLHEIGTNLTPQPLQPREVRWERMGQRPVIAWLTGLSGAGKSSVANAVDRALTEAGRSSMVLDGDNLRHGLSRDLGFTAADRVENIRRAAETARLMADAGLVVIVSLISPFQAERQAARVLAGDIPFLEVFIDTPLAVCEARDPKGLYDRARAGLISDFTGISAPYERPAAPDLTLSTPGFTVADTARPLFDALLNLSRLEMLKSFSEDVDNILSTGRN
nr:adenylyl-sulfate kinase [Methylorubrum suomiense]